VGFAQPFDEGAVGQCHFMPNLPVIIQPNPPLPDQGMTAKGATLFFSGRDIHGAAQASIHPGFSFVSQNREKVIVAHG
jgi:hypothetical protein